LGFSKKERLLFEPKRSKERGRKGQRRRSFGLKEKRSSKIDNMEGTNMS
jgi:hypothetical protein